jgi:hypothetical protein
MDRLWIYNPFQARSLRGAEDVITHYILAFIGAVDIFIRRSCLAE